MKSEPKVLVLSGNGGRWSYRDRLKDADAMSGVEGYVFAMNGDYIHTGTATEHDISQYDVVIGNTNNDQIETLTRLARSRPGFTKWVTLIEGSLTDYTGIKTSERYNLRLVRELFDASDLVTGMNRFGEGFLQSMTGTPCRYIGSPYPAEKIRYKFSKRIKKNEILLSHLLNERWLNWLASRKITERFEGYVTKGVHTEDMKLGPGLGLAASYGENDVRYQKVGSQEFWLEFVSTSKLCIDLDPRYTWGRAVLDCAALGVPMIGTRSKGIADIFFPDLVVEREFDFEKVYELAFKLITDMDFYKECADVPIESFEMFRPETVVTKLLNFL